MIDLSSPELWVIAAMGVAVGVFIGWVLTSMLHKRSGGGKKVVELRKELEDYRGEVNAHFAHTAELFRDMSEKYRDVYDHLATGAQSLCTDLPAPAQLDFLPGGLLAASRPADAAPADAAPAATVAADAVADVDTAVDPDEAGSTAGSTADSTDTRSTRPTAPEAAHS